MSEEYRDHYTMSLSELRRLCREYDREQGTYPEHKCEGWAVYRHVISEILGDDLEHDHPENWL